MSVGALVKDLGISMSQCTLAGPSLQTLLPPLTPHSSKQYLGASPLRALSNIYNVAVGVNTNQCLGMKDFKQWKNEGNGEGKLGTPLVSTLQVSIKAE